MPDQSANREIEIGNTQGNNNVTIIAITDRLVPSDIKPDNLVSTIKDHLNGLEKRPPYEWTTITVLIAFGAYCVLLLTTPFLLSSRGIAIADIQSMTLAVASAMSGITGLLGVILGGRMRFLGK